jgi:3',5'-cyclic AMP phosphodiesterase CpdA
MRWYNLLTALLASSTLCTVCTFAQRTDTLLVLHTSDTHVVYSPDQYASTLIQYFTGDRSPVDSVDRFFKTVPIREHADAVVITGDLVSCFEAENRSGKLAGGHVEQFRRLAEVCPVPLLMTLGNHDISSYTFGKSDSARVTSQTVAGRARAAWIRNIPCFADGTYYTRLFEVGGTRYHFVFLDDGYSLHDGGRRLDKTQLDWLTEQVQKAGDEPMVLFHHIYFGLGDVNHDGVAFDSRKPVDWPGEKECQEGFLKLINEHRNIKLLVVGHGHENVFEEIHFPSGHNIYQVETGSVSEGAANWRRLRFTAKGIEVSKPGSKTPEFSIEVHEKGQ